MNRNILRQCFVGIAAITLLLVLPGGARAVISTPVITGFLGCQPDGSTPCFPNQVKVGGMVSITLSGPAADVRNPRIGFGNSSSGVAATVTAANELSFKVPAGVAVGTYPSITLASDNFNDIVYNSTITVQAGSVAGSAPVVDALSSCATGPCPVTGQISTGDKSLTISGSNLRPVDQVLINGQSVTPTGSNVNQITVNLPTGLTTGQLVVKVITPSGEVSKTFTVSAAGPNPPGPNPPGPAGPTPPQVVSSDLQAECAKQGLTYDSSTGLCLPANPFNASGNSLAKATSVGDLIKRILDILLTLAGVIAVLFIVIGGYSYITSRGNEKQATSGRQTLTYAIIGLAAVLLAYTLVNVLTNLFTQGKLFGQ